MEQSERAQATSEVAGRDAGAARAARARASASDVLAGRKGLALHGALLALGTAFLLVPAFSTVTWFDESYSVALAAQPLGELVSIAAADVHPPLYYLLLHAVYLVAGPSVTAYRLFSVAGTVATAALGLTHVRRDFGPRAGLLFTLAACFTPYLAYQAVQVRMYSWAAFAVTLCFLSACRVLRAWRHGERPHAATWVAFAVSSLAAAYLHYFGMMAAFILNAALLVALLRGRFAHRRAGKAAAEAAPAALHGQLAVFLVQAVVQVAAYVPWLMVLMAQLAEKTNGRFWVTFAFPESLLQILAYPLASEQVAYWAEDPGAPFALRAAVVAVIALTLVVAAAVLVRGALRGPCPVVRTAARLACAVYAGTAVLAVLVSQAMGSLIVYYRYFSIVLGPVLVAVAAVLGRAQASKSGRGAACSAAGAACGAAGAPCDGKEADAVLYGAAVSEHAGRARASRLMRVATAWCCAALMACGLLHQGLAAAQTYSAENNEAFAYLGQTAHERAVNETPLPVLSNDVTVLGTAWAEGTDARLVYANFYDGYWNRAYACYEPGITSADTIAQALGATDGAFLYLDIAQSPDSSVGTVKDPEAAVARMEELTGSRAVETRTFWRPYEHRTYHVTLFEPAA